MRKKFGLVLFSMSWAGYVYGSPTGTSVGINFGADEPNAQATAVVEGAAGVVGSKIWNNTEFQTGDADGLLLDVNGASQASSVRVDWTSNNTWSSAGRGEENNSAPEGNDRNLMLGYLDTTDTSITEVNVTGLPPAIASGFDVIVYVQGGVNGRGGTYTVTAGAKTDSLEYVQDAAFDGSYVEGSNYLFFSGLSGSDLRLEAQATTTALLRAPVNGIEICAAGTCGPPPFPVAGRGAIGTQSLTASIENKQLGPASLGPGLLQEWYQANNPGNKDGVNTVFETQDPAVPAFRAAGTSWWTGTAAEFGPLPKYPSEVQPTFNGTDNNNYVVRSTGEILIPESGTYRFADGVDDYTYLAIDTNKSGVAGDVPEEVLIDDNDWTGVYRADNGGGTGWAETSINVGAGGEWLDVEFNMAEGGGGDAGVLYWDYNPAKPAGQRIAGGAGFPEDTTLGIDPADAEALLVPDSHLRSTAAALISADRVGQVPFSRNGYEFEINGTTDTADVLDIPNPDPSIYTTVLDVNGLRFHINGTGTFANGDSFQIVKAGEIKGAPVIVSSQPWTFNPATGRVTYGAGLLGDYNGNGSLDAGDLDLQATAMVNGGPAGTYDLNSDGSVNYADRLVWVNSLKKTWIGDANLDGQFNTSDFVEVFQSGKFETGAEATWSQGDWDGNKLFNTSDFIAAFQEGGYEAGPKAAVSAVPEPSSMVMLALGGLGLLGSVRRRR